MFRVAGFKVADNVGAMRLFCPTRNYQVTMDFHGQNGVLARVMARLFFMLFDVFLNYPVDNSNNDKLSLFNEKVGKI